MMYGLLIGLIIASTFMWVSNPPRTGYPVPLQIARSTVRITGLVIFMSSTGALIGLLIRGA